MPRSYTTITKKVNWRTRDDEVPGHEVHVAIVEFVFGAHARVLRNAFFEDEQRIHGALGFIKVTLSLE